MNYGLRRFLAAWPWLAVTVVSVLVTLAVMLPAAWIVPQFAKATSGHVNLVDPAGSLWKGSATLMLATGGGAGGGDGATLLPGRLEWRTAFWPLFSGRVRMEMRQTDAMPDAVFVDAGPSGSTVSPGTIAVPASLLTGLGAPFNTLNMDGNVRLTWTELRMLGHNTYGQVIVTLDDMASSVSRVKPLGSYRVVFQAEGQAGTIDLTTSRGPLLLSGQGTVSPASSAFNGVATSAPEARENLAGLLNLLGRHTGPDTVELTFGR
ncbi:type II secretion system protein N [Caballeronia mineralivorans]|jgi:general secretion pathway protein N|uniref:type II secretion system protein N n=1 Tax=Caballeronia mineralivorans TaxID=2010198 RepID=UPI0023F41B5A|nr:type II secretion system protein N [Caballeronia mineralivorans]MDB5780512.1 ral secretion pathway protein GspN [Caballeronia mineralivorans]MEA3097061.1 ral secretion pathway protein [Caballeronia mineralivorans]